MKLHKELAMEDLKNQFFGKVTGDVDPIKKILAKVPGFGGYVERQSRRDADKLIRETLFKQFRDLETRVSVIERDFVDQGDIDYVDDLERTAIKLRTFADRVRTATRGYSGLFDAVKINEVELAHLYDYDAAMLDLVDGINHAIDNVEASVGTDGLKAAIRNLETTAAQAITTFDQREQVVKGS
jgi:hypothetical protein